MTEPNTCPSCGATVEDSIHRGATGAGNAGADESSFESVTCPSCGAELVREGADHPWVLPDVP